MRNNQRTSNVKPLSWFWIESNQQVKNAQDTREHVGREKNRSGFNVKER